MDPIPVSEHQLCQYVSFLANHGLAHKTIKSYLSAVRHLQIKVPRPHHKLHGSFRASIEGFLRAGEMTVPSDHAYDPGVHLNFDDIAIDSKINPSIMRVTIKASKTDPFRQGIKIFVGRTHTDLCLIEAMLAYLAVQGGIQGPLFAFADGWFLTRDRLVHHVRDALSTAGVDCTAYAGHSFRIGAATTAARRGIQDATIKMLGRWESSAYLLYIKTPRDQLSAVSSIL